ncbi:hypothetical protein KPH14_005485 [Odynerus spinipes]|uniref:Endothelin-converting enzyme-like 1 n=1 Tax=Odynerus spinipes TaxID=1348599 RepID=A0AAD9RBT3_9HYME|nr:hypothetical protein KPH14_005485 [Odynerus spinipes]
MLPYFARICVLLIIFLKNWSVTSHPWNEYFFMNRPICNSQKCKEQAKFLNGIINRKVNPCDDFYEYVCGRWEEKYPLPAYYSEWSIDMVISVQSMEQLREILEETPSDNDVTGLKHAKALYKACVNIPSLDLMDAQSLRYYINTVNNFPLFLKKAEIVAGRRASWLAVHNYYLSLTGDSAFFAVNIKANKEDNMKPLLRISPMVSPFGLIEPAEILTVLKYRLYKEFLLALINHVIPANMFKVSYALIEKRLLDVLVFRRQIWKLTLHYETPTGCSPGAMHKFDDLYSDESPISWSKIVYALYKNTDKPLSINSMKICIDQKKYFYLLGRIINRTPYDVIVNHIQLYFIERHLHLTPHLRELLMKTVIRDGKLEERIRYLGRRGYRCITDNEERDAIGKAYIRKFFPLSKKKEGELIVNKLKEMMKIQVDDSTWLNNVTKHKALNTIDNMKTAIGYPDYYDNPLLLFDYSNSKETVQPALTEAFYSVHKNRLSISASFFTPPLYHLKFPQAIIFGTIGGLLAHEMYHAFSTDVVDCKNAPSCWSKTMSTIHAMKSVCYFTQFHNKTVIELNSIPNAPKIDGLRTIDENISDSMGLNLAYWTFRKETWKTKKCTNLNLYDITCEQLFFISFALSFCGTRTLDKTMEAVQYHVHSTDRLRVNGAVSNLKEFSEAFKCRRNSPMNPSKKCYLWK